MQESLQRIRMPSGSFKIRNITSLLVYMCNKHIHMLLGMTYMCVFVSYILLAENNHVTPCNQNVVSNLGCKARLFITHIFNYWGSELILPL